MLMQAIDSYLQLRRAGGYQLRDTEVLLKEFACFAAERGEIHIKADTAIAWASRATSQQQRDRKSTRLNSSHGYISYAVFCLKKKKKIKKQRYNQQQHHKYIHSLTQVSSRERDS